METSKPFIIVNIHYTDIPRGSTNNDFLENFNLRNFITILLLKDVDLYP